MSSQNADFTVLPLCDPAIKAALIKFSQACTPSHSTRSKAFSIWSLVQEYVEPPLEAYLDGCGYLKYPECFNGNNLAKAVRQDAYKVEDTLRLCIRDLIDEGHENAAATLESLLYLIYFCKSHKPTRSVGENALRGAAKKTLLHRFDGNQYPYCELCWKFSMKAELDSGKHDDLRLSARFCSDHDQKNPQSMYRTDHNHRDQYHQKIKEIHKELPYQRMKWKELAGDTDETSIRRYAYLFVHSIAVDDRLMVKKLLDAGNSNPDIVKATGLSRQMVHKIISTPLKSRYGRTSNGQIIDTRLLALTD
ncbi:hypothetical protein D3C72_151320 [compost metagenome]